MSGEEQSRWQFAHGRARPFVWSTRRSCASAVLFRRRHGGVDPGLHIGDVVIADRCGQYLEHLYAFDTFGARAAGNAATVVKALLRALRDGTGQVATV